MTITFDDLTPWDINRFIHTLVMGEEMEWCRQYLFTDLSEDMYQCRGCQRIGTFEVLTLMHEKPIPNYAQSLDVLWKVVSHLCIPAIGFEYRFFKTSDTHGDNVMLWMCHLDYNDKRTTKAAKMPQEALIKAILYVSGVTDKQGNIMEGEYDI